MVRKIGFATVLLATASPVAAQRANENAVTSASDAFGNMIGAERIGLYNDQDVRGFSAVRAGNVRVEGMYVDLQGGFTGRIITGSTIRVGLTAQGYPFPAPTGIADFRLRSSGDEALLSAVAYFGPEGTRAIDLDGQIPIVEGRLSAAVGTRLVFDEAFVGDNSLVGAVGGVVRWRPTDDIEIKPFTARLEYWDDRSMPLIFTRGAYLPPKVPRRYFGLDWTESRRSIQMNGVVGTANLSEAWTLRTGLFRWDDLFRRGFIELFQNVQRDGSAQRTVVAERNQRFGSTSGEVRLSRTIADGDRRHIVHFAARGRDTDRRYGGADREPLGAADIGRRIDVAMPSFSFGERSADKVRQTTGGIAYEGLWRGVGELSLGLQRTDYQKTTTNPAGLRTVSKDDPWLYNGTLAIYASDRLAFYAGYTRGLEESGTAPENAVNKNEAPPALRTSQRDAGIRYVISPGFNLVAGVFDVRKPYFNLDPSSVFRQLGQVRHRGVELSLAGQPLPGLNVVAGCVFLDAEVSGEAVKLGVIGPKAVGTLDRQLRLNLDYRLPFEDSLSVDLGLVNFGSRVASGRTFAELEGRQLEVPGRTTVDIGGRYRFEIGDAPATLRLQVTNLFNRYSWEVSPTGSFRFSDRRRFIATLAADF